MTEKPELPDRTHPTSGSWARSDRADDRGFEHGENSWWHSVPVVTGFRPNGLR